MTRRLTLSALLICLIALTTACGIPTLPEETASSPRGTASAPHTSPSSTSTKSATKSTSATATKRASKTARSKPPTTSSDPQTTPKPVPTKGGKPASAFAELAASRGGQIGIAWTDLGGRGNIHTAGSWSSGPAWSTMKVPVAIAVLRQNGSTNDQMRAAITRSDNTAAMGLWRQLGSPQQAGAKSHQVLARAGDTETTVQTTVTRAGFTPFGQTNWPLTSQARFMAGVACQQDAAPVISLMGQISPDQRWGLGRIPGVVGFKGGWGPGPDGRYLVRQMGVIRTPKGGQIAIAIASAPASGSFDGGISDLNAIADWIGSRDDLGGRRSC